jgi:hypothetical protein
MGSLMSKHFTSSPSQDRYLYKEKHKHRHACFEWDWNSPPQCSSRRRRFMPQTARPLWSARHVIKLNILQLLLKMESHVSYLETTSALIWGMLIVLYSELSLAWKPHPLKLGCSKDSNATTCLSKIWSFWCRLDWISLSFVVRNETSGSTNQRS